MKLHKTLMSGRDYSEHHRVSTPLELFFDLIFVIAISSASGSLHHALMNHHVASGLISFTMSFFSIWWAWMNFTWFASAYDTDDTAYRLTTFLLMFGALVFAVGVDDIFDQNGRPVIPVIGFVIMRLAMIIHWLRAAKEDPENRRVALRYAKGITFAQICWVSWLFVPQQYTFLAFLVFMVIELMVPVYAESKKITTSWHPHHIAERYGLMVIIVLGEGLLGVSNTIGGLLRNDTTWNLIAYPLGFLSAALIFALWWSYFEIPWGEILEKKRTFKVGWVFGYIHVFVFASLAAVGTSLELIADTSQQQYMHFTRNIPWSLCLPSRLCV